ncbi:mesoderm-specific transcript protein-like isoform X2 [Acanthaster planci]|uniref:Mesoderm-specific transcript protein-like isoform X2 n=1 Tax=Acanthaster planci TaxID=133434 RepID=A0A8B7Z2V5_ACAPL|nr:mesoderm-specific transcript protein-like isoform X2 [Acanthaster planci]
MENRICTFYSNMLSVKSVAVLIALVAVYCNWPQPPLSERLQKWKTSGKYFKFKDFNIFYKDSLGQDHSSDDRVVLILHGFPSSTFDWYKMWDGLTGHFERVIAPDFIGFGLSDKPRDHAYTMFEQADIMEALLAELGVNQVHILAHDMGDTVAQELIARQNAQTKSNKKPKLEILSACLTNGGILPETHQPRFMQKLMMNPWIAPIGMRVTNRLIFRKAFGEVFGERTQPTSDEFEDHWVLIRWNDGNLITYDLIQYLPQRYANRDKWVGALQETKIPLHLIYGPSDPINPPNTFLKRYKMLIPDSGVTELADHISHYPQLEDPENVLKAYVKFMDRLKIN